MPIDEQQVGDGRAGHGVGELVEQRQLREAGAGHRLAPDLVAVLDLDDLDRDAVVGRLTMKSPRVGSLGARPSRRSDDASSSSSLGRPPGLDQPLPGARPATSAASTSSSGLVGGLRHPPGPTQTVTGTSAASISRSSELVEPLVVDHDAGLSSWSTTAIGAAGVGRPSIVARRSRRARGRASPSTSATRSSSHVPVCALGRRPRPAPPAASDAPPRRATSPVGTGVPLGSARPGSSPRELSTRGASRVLRCIPPGHRGREGRRGQNHRQRAALGRAPPPAPAARALLVEIEGKSGLAVAVRQRAARLRRGASSPTGDALGRTLTPDEALLEYLQDHGLSRISKRLVSSGALDDRRHGGAGHPRHPRARQGEAARARRRPADLIVLDAPAAGHAITLPAVGPGPARRRAGRADQHPGP